MVWGRDPIFRPLASDFGLSARGCRLNFHLKIGNWLSIGKALSPDVAAFVTGSDVDDSTSGKGAQLVSPYVQSSWVYIAISRLAEKISSIPFRISRMDAAQAKRVRALRGSADPKHRSFVRRSLGETIIESGDVVDLFNRPHPMMSRQLFWEMVVTWNCLRGEFFILPLDDADLPVDLAMSAPQVKRLITLPTELFWHIVQGYDLTAWRYTGSPLLTPIPSEILLPSELIHSRQPNPYLFWRGMSPLLVALGAAGADFAASKYNQGYWLNNADTGLIVTTEQQATKEQQIAIMSALRERKRKAGTPDRPLFLFGGAKVDKPQLSGMETTFIENRKMNRQEILAIFKMSDSVIGLTDEKSKGLNSGGSAIDSEEIKFVESTIGPLCNHIEAAIDPIVKTFGPGLCGWFDVDGLPIMQEARRARADTAVKVFGIGASFNDINLLYDLGFPEYPGFGDKNFLPFNLQDANAAPEPLPGEVPPAPGDKPENDKDKANPFARMTSLLSSLTRNPKPETRKPDTKLVWQSHVKSRRKTVKLMQAKVSKVLLEFRGKTLAKLAEIHLEKSGPETRNPKPETKSLIDLIFNPHDFGNSLHVELTNPILATLQLAGDELNQELGLDDPWKMPPDAAKEFLSSRKQPILGVGGTVRDQLNTSLQEGLDAGETHAQLSDRVKGVYNNLTNYEAKRVALTETNMAYNNARHLAMTDAGIEYKAWLSSHGPNVRPAHAEAEENYIDDPIPLDEPFEVDGDQLLFPGDDSLGAGLDNIINCQCIQLAAQKTSEDEKTITFKIFGVGERTFSKN